MSDANSTGPQSRRWTGRSSPFAILVLLGLSGLGCATAAPTGPLFVGPEPARSGSTGVYLYRLDAHHSYSTVEIRFDGGESMAMLDEEYTHFELGEGAHEVEFRLRSAIWRGGRWRTQILRTRPDENLFVHVSVGLEERVGMGGRDLEIAGREHGIAGESVTVEVRAQEEALEQLRRTHRREPPPR